MLHSSPGSGILLFSADAEANVANLLLWVLQIKLVIAEAFGSIVIRGDVSQIIVESYATHSGSELVEFCRTLAGAIANSFTCGNA